MQTTFPAAPKRVRHFARRASMRVASLLLQLSVAAVLIAMLIGGITLIQMRSESRAGPAPSAPIPVATVELQPVTSYEVVDRFVGRVEAHRSVDAAFERGGLVIAVTREEGDRAHAGATLARLDTSLLEAERERLRAERQRLTAEQELARLTEERQVALNARGHASQQVLDEARLSRVALDAAIGAIDASIARIELDIDKSVVTAPFAGIIGARHVDPGTVVDAGAPVVALYASGHRLARVGMAPQAASMLQKSEPIGVHVGGKVFEGRVAAVRPDLSPTTRTVPVLIDLPEGLGIALGDTVEVRSPRMVDAEGFWVPQAALTEGERGLWTVLTVVAEEAGHRVGSEAVELVHVSEGRALVRGTLRGGQKIVAQGRHRVVPGQRVIEVETGPDIGTPARAPLASASTLGSAL